VISKLIRASGIERLSALYILAVFIIVFGVWTPNLFFSLATVHLVASQQVVVGMLAMAVLVPLACGAFDLSVGANVNLSAVLVCILQVQDHYSMWSAIAISILASGLVGVFNGFIVVRMKVNSFIATLASSTIVGAILQMITGGNQPYPVTTRAWSQLTQLDVGGFQVAVIYLIVLAAIVWWLMARTPTGRYMYAIGSNAEAARLSGVKVGQWTWLSFAISGTICGVAGVIYASLAGPSLSFGAFLLLPAFAAVYLGSTQLQPGRLNVWGTIIAIYVIATGVQGVEFVTSVQWVNQMFNGVALVLAVSFAGWRQRAVVKLQRAERSAAVEATSIVTT
jgi:ribose transport system permease protein